MSVCRCVYDCGCIVSMEDRRGCQIARDSYSDCEPPNMGNGIQTQAIYMNSMCSQLLSRLCSILIPAGFVFDFLNGGGEYYKIELRY